MRITLLTTSVSRRAGGLFDALRGLATGLSSAADMNVRVLGLADEDTARDLGAWNGTPVEVVPVRGPSWFGFSPALGTKLLEDSPHLVHVHGLWTYPSAACRVWARKTRRPYLVAPHGMLDPWALRNSRWKKRLAAWGYQGAHLRGAACLHALCQSEARAIRAYGLRNPICILPNGVEFPPHSAPSPPPWERTLPQGARVLLYLGRFHPKKNLMNLLRAWRLARYDSGGRTDEWHLVLVGWDQGGYADQLKTLVCDLGIEGSVRIAGPQYGEAKDAAFRRAAAFVLPSLSEGLPMAVLEAWSYGLPVLMTPESNLPEGFQVGAALPLGTDTPDIARGLTEFFSTSDTERAAMGARGQQLILRRHSWENLGRQMASVYAWLLGGEKPSDVNFMV
jgi:glycosyltransferase involved in cell wall biosynthesis